MSKYYVESLIDMLLLWLALACISGTYFAAASSYVGAVAEHSIFYGSNSDSSEYKLDVNIQLYENLTILARNHGAQVLVFPEFGLTPVESATNRADLYPFAEVIPDVIADPSTENYIIPCDSANDFQDRPILFRMSCAARENKILVLVNMIDFQSCDATQDQNCPEDGHYQYNTDVLFDEMGQLVQKYHKSHEWPGLKVAYDQPLEPSEKSYVSSFGVEFGLFICFDIMFEDPAKVLRANGVEHFLYAVKQGELGEALLIRPWSERNAATVLSANLGSGKGGKRLESSTGAVVKESSNFRQNITASAFTAANAGEPLPSLWGDAEVVYSSAYGASSGDPIDNSDCSAIIVNGTELHADKYFLDGVDAQFLSENILVATIPIDKYEQ